ncbi:PIG-L family deacetylase [Streptomyces actuosus]|uniref:PIG-L family deacetylase n=1 Tax=Streptomyces actuosus TaxID=1885 RepID=A0ABS2VHJ9_STRAS|nr:PIG-L family deacetylase [Streptomyces actuosus]MBN0042559.1 PIG-L family deacetylase [Streptomyces actuosus]
MPAPNVLAVFAHPDDESLSAGGLLARHAAAGARTAVVTATWAAGTVRAGELADALRVLGAGAPRLLGYADERVPHSAPGRPRLCDTPPEQVVARVVAHIRDVRPDVVVTHDAHGGLPGHPDHVRTHEVTARAVRVAGLGHLHPDTGAPWQPRELRLATHPQSAVPALQEAIGAHKAVHSVPDDQVGTALDVGPWLERKIAAILAHRSEVERGALPGVIAGLSPEARRRLFGTEWYICHALTAGHPAVPETGSLPLSDRGSGETAGHRTDRPGRPD